MAKKRDFSIEGMDVLGLSDINDAEQAKEKKKEAPPPQEPKPLPPTETEAARPSTSRPAARPNTPPSPKLTQKAYYITPEQYDRIRLYAITSKDPALKDASAIVRAAIDEFFERRG
ncbi:hypothetical protein LJC74_03415 [Eubacteriales bacterium OttesenSCG-928-A19]|nr:hypothetical protein [Eubacteriales bacterium OttesenSCG-928-A19]